MIMREAVPHKKAGEPDAGRELTPWLVLLAVPLVLMFSLQLLRPILVGAGKAGSVWGALFGDHRLRWAECRWLMLGIDPIDGIRGLVPAPDPSMQLPEVAVSFPWAYVLGNPLSFAFLPLEASKVLSLACNALCGVGLMLAGHRFVLKKTGCRPLAVWTVLLLACTVPFCNGLFYGNYGFLCGLLLIAAVWLAPAHPVLAGLCLMFASTKPQLAALFYLALLLELHWKPVLVGGLGTLGAWGIAAAACHTSPLTMLYETFAQSTGTFYAARDTFGIFNNTLPRSLGMFASMAVCTLAMVLACLWLRRRRDTLPHWQLFYYSLPAVFSCIWTYSNLADHSVLYLLYALTILCFWEVIRARGVRLSLVLLALAALCWMLQPPIVEDFLYQMWDTCIPGQLTDGLFLDLVGWVPICSWWGLCWLCAAPGRLGERFRALL